MNWKQKTVLWIGIAVIVTMGLFSPLKGGRYQPHAVWRVDMSLWSRRFHSFGYERLWVLTEPEIGFSKLFIQWCIVGLVTGGLIVTFKDKKPNDEQKR